MRTLAIAACVAGAACAGGNGGADSAAARPADTVIVAGPPAIQPQTPAPETTPPAQKTPAPPATKTPTSPAVSRGPDPADSIRGIVSVVGTSFERRVMVSERGTQRRVEITGPLSRLVGHVAGAEVSVAGSLSGSQLEARRFLVRAVDGQPAIDGTLRTEAGTLYIVTGDGAKTRIAAPPPPLVGQDGARVWITGDPATSVQSFGFIDPPR